MMSEMAFGDGAGSVSYMTYKRLVREEGLGDGMDGVGSRILVMKFKVVVSFL